jgi:hypothetical protein
MSSIWRPIFSADSKHPGVGQFRDGACRVSLRHRLSRRGQETRQTAFPSATGASAAGEDAVIRVSTNRSGENRLTVLSLLFSLQIDD